MNGKLTDNPPFFDLVGQVRAMRRLKPDPVPLELIRKVLEAGVQASSGANSQPWRFLVVHSTAQRDWFGARYKDAMYQAYGHRFDPDPSDKSSAAGTARAVKHQADHMSETPVIVLVAGKRDWPFRVPEHERVGLAPPNYGAIYPCVQNILLACRSLKLGAALTTMHQLFEDELHKYFKVPEEYGIVVAIPIGYPSGRFGPVTRIPAAELTYFDSWGNDDAESWA